MRSVLQIAAAFLVVAAVSLIARGANGQAAIPANLDLLSCSPAPCTFLPVRASDSGKGVVNAPIAANPLNSKQLLLGSSDGNCIYPIEVAFHISTDGGSKWSHYCMAPLMTPQGEEFAGGQPMLGFDRNGIAYIAAGFGGPDTDGATAFQTSKDGVHWSPPAVAIPGSKHSKPIYGWMAIDASGQSPWVNSLYITSVFLNEPDQDENQVVVAYSHDGGATWKQVPAEPVQKAPAEDSFPVLGVGSDGTIYMAWLHCLGQGQAAHCNNGKAYIVFSKSTNGGNTWSTPNLVAEVNMPLNWTLPNTDVRVYNYPAIAVDNSNGPNAGNLYVSMYSWTGTYLRVQVVRSTDGGNTWSKPVPVAPPSENHDQFFPWLAVSPKGLVGVSWLDRRNDPANVNYQAFGTISSDGGKSYHPDVQLTTAFSNPNANGNIWIGDYTGSTWAGPNNFLAAWMDNSNSYYMTDFVGGIRVK